LASSSAWHTGLSGGAPDSVRCLRLDDVEPAALGNRWSCTAINHRTVRWCTGLSGESSATNSSVSGNEKGDVAKIHRTVRSANWASGQWSSTRSMRDTWPAPTVGWVHRTVPGAPTSLEEQQSDAPDMEGDHATNMNSGCSVVHRTVRCTTRQKAEIAFQVGLQRLLAAVGR
jgi:hypothetical protein